ncbi:hypothetical protein FRC06_001668, partial [Ceratobasidium sp. 370]
MPICWCCSREDLSDQQIRWHLRNRQLRLKATLDARDENDDGLAPDDDDGPAPNDDGPAPDDDDPPYNNDDMGSAFNDDKPVPHNYSPGIEPTPDNAAPRWRGIDLVALVAREGEHNHVPTNTEDVNKMDLDDGEDPCIPLPDVPSGPVMINDWASEDKLEDIAPPEPDIDNASIGSDELDPEFNKDDWMWGIDPDAEPDMDEEELWGYLRQHLGDLAGDEWLDIYNRFLTDEDRKTLQFLAARQHTHFSWAIYEDMHLHTCQELGLLSDFIAWMRLKSLSGLES